jgi:nucleotide-binding universal stress UspA family protein
MFSRILVPTDFSPPSDAALEYARILAAKFGSSLRILHVIDDPTAASEFVSDGFAPSTEDIRTGLLEHGRKRLEQLLNLVDRSRYHAMPTWSWDRRPRQSSTTRRRPARV